MLEEIKKLEKHKKEYEDLMSEIKIRNSMFEIEMSNLYEKADSLKLAIKKSEDTIRDGAIMGYLYDQNKNRPYGIKVKIVKNIEYDNAKALEYAKKHLMFLELNKKKFESYAKSSYEKDPEIKEICSVTEEPKAYLPAKFDVGI